MYDSIFYCTSKPTIFNFHKSEKHKRLNVLPQYDCHILYCCLPNLDLGNTYLINYIYALKLFTEETKYSNFNFCQCTSSNTEVKSEAHILGRRFDCACDSLNNILSTRDAGMGYIWVRKSRVVIKFQ